MDKILKPLCQVSNLITEWFNSLSHLFALGNRIYLARIFLWSGWLKYSDWQTTLNLFEYEYKVPFFTPKVAAYLGTGAEVIFGFLILVGLGARLPALGLLLTNILMILSYPILLSAEGVCMIKDHYLWALSAAVILFYGHGAFSLDWLLKKKVCNEYKL